ncbi:hypothetical protein [Vannielia litorea]|uniref:hypothetical protein n=1 Tax=Vannielia litorea TaxID=1217970 RepID=UPI001BCB7F98|nr:hypothetical protein [Vannielia litorea]MBS8227369.1 hypothetical protein [Vannielia litorea]
MSQPQILLCTPNTPEGEATLKALTERLVPQLTATGLATLDAIQNGAYGYGIATVIPDNHLAETLRAQALSSGFELVTQIALDTQDQTALESEIERLTAGTELAGKFYVGRWLKITEADVAGGSDTSDQPAAPVLDTGKTIEIYYDAGQIPPGYSDPLSFRNAAIDLIEAALAKAGVGEWAGAESGANLVTGEPEVNFGFDVTEFERAEEIVREAVRGTPFEGIREISRFEASAQS